jgi:hypothetical protein
MTEAIFYSALGAVVIGSAWWFLREFAGSIGEQVAFPRRPARRERAPAWMRREAGTHRLPEVPPVAGPVRLPSFAARQQRVTRAQRAPRRTQRPRRQTPLRHAS